MTRGQKSATNGQNFISSLFDKFETNLCSLELVATALGP